MAEAVVDTDVLSALMRKHPVAVARAREYLVAHGYLTFSIISKYEILRGLSVKKATAQRRSFDEFCSASKIVALNDEIITQAADIYADLYSRGELIGDADILIAASAVALGASVVTNNERHFRRIRNLRVENWLKEQT